MSLVLAQIVVLSVTRSEHVQPSVWNVEQLNPDPFMADLNAYGLPWVETYPTEKLPGE
jgi:saccharopine dehydrogenase (NAD+, L-lysine-forming)